jgi:hypothetical protein
MKRSLTCVPQSKAMYPQSYRRARQEKCRPTYSKHRLFLFLQFRQAICVLLLADASPSWWDALVAGLGGVFGSIIRISAYDASDAPDVGFWFSEAGVECRPELAFGTRATNARNQIVILKVQSVPVVFIDHSKKEAVFSGSPSSAKMECLSKSPRKLPSHQHLQITPRCKNRNPRGLNMTQGRLELPTFSVLNSANERFVRLT